MPRMLPPEYENRPQAFIKHQLLESYLERLVMIVGANATELCYVDAFAGPWSDSDDMESTSIGISLRTLERCARMLGARGSAPRIRALFIERDANRFARLSSYLASRTTVGVEADCKHGNFVALRQEILGWIGSSVPFAFFFLDPTGWKDVGVPTLQPLLERPRSEFLINFMYNYINWTASMPEWQLAIDDFLGRVIDVDALTPPEREKEILAAYRASCKQRMPARAKYPPRSAYARILDPTKNRPKYHLVYLTSHPKGAVTFMEISQDADIVQRQVRAEAKQADREAKSGMADLFGDERPPEPNPGQVSGEAVDKFWREYLLSGGGKRLVGLAQFADILERTDWFPGDLQASLRRLIMAKEVRNLDAPNAQRRTKNPLHFEENGGQGERLQLEGWE